MTTCILLVDDDAVQATTRKAILERAGKSVFVAPNAKAGLNMLQDPEFFSAVGLVITDHLMPQMNGPQFITALRDFMPTLPVLVLSGFPDGEAEYEGLDIVYRVKPFAPDQLIHLVKSLMSEPMSRTA